MHYLFQVNGTICEVKKLECFLGFQVVEKQRQCLNVKVCEFSSKELDIVHTFVDFSKPLLKNTFKNSMKNNSLVSKFCI